MPRNAEVTRRAIAARTVDRAYAEAIALPAPRRSILARFLALFGL